MRFILVICVISSLACIATADDTTPELTPGVKSYFQRADAAKETMQRKYETRILDLEIAIQGAADPQNKAQQRRDLEQTKDRLAELKKSKVFAFLPEQAQVGDIGSIPPCVVKAVIDDKTAVFAQRNIPPGKLIVATKTNTTSLKAREQTNSPETWRVVATTSTDAKIQRVVDREEFVVVEPVKKGELEKLRAAYLAANLHGNEEKTDVHAAPNPELEKLPKSLNAPARAVTKGPFTLWREPADFKANAIYEIVVVIQLPEGTDQYSGEDLTGKIESSDKYVQSIKPGKETFAVEAGFVKLKIKMPGTPSKLKDTITIESKLLDQRVTQEVE